MFSMNPEMIMLVGASGSGKSTFHKNAYSKYPFVSSDYYIEKWAKERGTTYNEIFPDSIKEARRQMDLDVKFVDKMGISFVWDQTNLTAKQRRVKLNNISRKFKRIAIAFELPLELIQKRNKMRERTISPHVIETMYKSYQRPTFEEGFDEIYIVNENHIFNLEK